jgi:signal transduction histidine kinase
MTHQGSPPGEHEREPVGDDSREASLRPGASSRPPSPSEAGPNEARRTADSGGQALESGAGLLHRSERLLAHAREIREQLAALGDRFPSIEEHAVAIVEHALLLLGASAGIAARVRGGETAELELIGAARLPADVIQTSRRLPLTAKHPLAEAVRTGHPVVAESRDEVLARFPVIADVLNRLGAHAVAAVPVTHMGRVQGAFGVLFAKPHHLAPHERRLLLALGGRFARALSRARLYFAEKEAREQAERARAAAEAADRAKDEFLAVMSHELRTPLNAILGYADLLADGVAGAPTAQQGDLLRRLRESGRQLLSLIEEVLGFARVQASSEQLAVERFDVSAVLEQVAAVATPLAEKKGLSFRMVAPSGGIVLESDPQKLQQILINLVGNAVKFTERGGITLEVRAEGDLVTFAVSDTGLGIAPEDLKHVFDAFWQADRGKTRAFGGAGLGLTITRQLVRLLGGDVAASSVVGVGSTFTVTLPLRAPGPS